MNELDIYTPLEEAKEEIWRRWNNHELKKDVARYLGTVPSVFETEPRVCLFRNVASPDNECIKFFEIAKQINLRPICGEYLDDKFVSRNRDKLGLAKMYFFHGWNKNGKAITTHRMTINHDSSNGNIFKQIETLWGENFINFHHRIFSLTPFKIELCDISSWLKRNGNSILELYPKYLALFICHGVLFEDFITNEEEEEEFFHSVVYPSFEKLINLFGLKPLIVSLLTSETPAIDKYWFCYSEEIEKEVLRCLNGKANPSK